MLHQKNSTTAQLFNVFGRCWIRKVLVVEPFSLIFYNKTDHTVIQGKSQMNILRLIISVSVFNGIVNRLCYSNHYITIYVVIQMKTLFGIVNKTFNHTNVFRDGRNLDTNGVHVWL